MYELFMLNFGYFLDRCASTLDEAVEIAKSTGFEVVIYCDGSPVKTVRGY